MDSSFDSSNDSDGSSSAMGSIQQSTGSFNLSDVNKHSKTLVRYKTEGDLQLSKKISLELISENQTSLSRSSLSEDEFYLRSGSSDLQEKERNRSSFSLQNF